jgi:hypothetical protein
MPSPTQLGVAAVRPASAGAAPDWLAARQQLQELGAVGFQLDRLPTGDWRFGCWLPTTDPAHPRRFEAQAATEAEAIRRTLDEAQRWKGPRS